jgi:hypothetical protein
VGRGGRMGDGAGVRDVAQRAQGGWSTGSRVVVHGTLGRRVVVRGARPDDVGGARQGLVLW